VCACGRMIVWDLCTYIILAFNFILLINNTEGGMVLFLKAGEDGKSIGDCPFAHYVRMVLEEKKIRLHCTFCNRRNQTKLVSRLLPRTITSITTQQRMLY